MKALKIIVPIVLVGVLAIGGFAIYKLFTSGVFNQGSQYKLSKVENISYDDDKYLLSWDEVKDADRYYVIINDEEKDYIEVNTNSYYYVVKDLVTTFKVQALADIPNEGGYSTLYKSDWSETFTYTIPNNNEVTYASVNAFVSTMMPGGFNLKKLVNISIDDNMLLTNAVFESDSKLKVYELETKYDFTVESLSDVVKESAPNARILNYYDIANYDSANSLLKSNSYVGQMEEYRQQGYTFEVISQQVGKTRDDCSNFKVYGTYKMSNGIETKYVNSTIVVGVTNASSYEKNNCTTKIENPENRILYEEYFKVLSGDEINVAKDMEDADVPLVLDFEDSNDNFIDANAKAILA